MTSDDSGEPDPALVPMADFDGRPMDEYGLPARVPRRLPGGIALAGILACLGVAAWMAVRTFQLHTRPHLWHMGVLAGLAPTLTTIFRKQMDVSPRQRAIIDPATGLAFFCALFIALAGNLGNGV